MLGRRWLVVVPFLLGLGGCPSFEAVAQGLASARYIDVRVRELPPDAMGLYDPDLHYDQHLCDRLESSAASRDHSVIGNVSESVVRDWLDALWADPGFDPEGLPPNSGFWAYEPTFVESAARACQFEPDEEPEDLTANYMLASGESEVEALERLDAAVDSSGVLHASLELEVELGLPDLPHFILITVPGPIAIGATHENLYSVVGFGSSARSGTATLTRFELSSIDVEREVATGRFQLLIESSNSSGPDTLFVVPDASFQLEVDFDSY